MLEGADIGDDCVNVHGMGKLDACGKFGTCIIGGESWPIGCEDWPSGAEVAPQGCQ